MPEEQKKEAAPASAGLGNCPACNKRIKKLKKYYRNGKYYCSKSCYSKFIEKQKKEKAKPKE